MNQETYEAFESVKRVMLDEARDCAWCGHHANSADELVLHIWDAGHSKFNPEHRAALVEKINQSKGQ